MKHVLSALLVFFVVGSALAQSPAKVRITTWNLQWFPNGSAREATPEKQAQRIKAAADVLKELNPDILLLQEVRDYDACNRLAEAIQSNNNIGVSHQILTDWRYSFKAGINLGLCAR